MSLCAKCSKPVYFAEQIEISSVVYHRFCFRCSAAHCNKILTLGKHTQHKCQLYCSNCYSKEFGTRSYAKPRPASKASSASQAVDQPQV